MYNQDLKIGISSFALQHASKLITQDEIAKPSGISASDLERHLGLYQKHVINDNECSSSLALNAAQKVMDKSDLEIKDISCIIYANAGVQDYQLWSTASYLQNQLGATDSLVFDINQGCNSLAAAMKLAYSLLSSHNNYKHVLLSISDVTSPFIDYSNHSLMPFFANADGAAALILSKHSKQLTILSQQLKVDGSYGNICKIPWGGVIARQELSDQSNSTGNKYIQFDIKNPLTKRLRDEKIALGYQEVIQAALREAKLLEKDITYIMITQHTSLVREKISNITNFDPRKIILTHPTYGHVGSIDPLIALKETLKRKQLNAGENILFATAGTGYFWGAQVIRF